MADANTMRVYIPASFDMLESLVSDGLLHARGGWGFAVTPALREFFVEGDEEELADVAFDEAARTSLRLLSGYEGRFAHRRVVVAVDVEAVPAEDMGDSVVKLAGPFSVDDVASVHVDVEGTEPLTKAAVEVVDKADLGDEDAELTVGDCLEVPLAWYDVAELGMLVDLL